MNNRTVVLYGAGELGKLASEFFEFYKIAYIICDDNPENYKDDPYWENFIIVKPEDIAKSYQILVCISTASYNMIRDKLREMGYNEIFPFFQYAEQIQKENGYKHPLTNGWQKERWKESEEDKCDKIANTFIDNQSLQHYYSFIHWHQFNTEFTYPEQIINYNDRYFIPEVISVLHDHETFIDVGAYDGRVTKKFIEIVKGNYNEIHCFEPNINNGILKNIDINKLKIHFYIGCLGNKNGIIPFTYEHNYLCKSDKKFKQISDIKKLDSCKNIEPTFIKIHVEGYELEVLKGSIKTIKKYRPILAVTTYHTEDGLYKIPLWLMKSCKDYNFYWRNHNYQGQGAVMYCIPKERNK